MYARVFTFYFLICVPLAFCDTANGVERKTEGLFSMIEDKLQTKIAEYVGYFTKRLEGFNDRHLGATELGRMIHYEDIKPKLELDAATGRSKATSGRNKKMTMAMLPLIFHVGATSTWMILTSIMAAKSVAIGLALLIFKIAVSSAKLASFFTLLKGKHSDHHGWTPHYEHHGHDRSFSDRVDTHIDHSAPEHHSPSHHHQTSDWHSYAPEWTPNDAPEYHTIPTSYGDSYKSGEIDASAFLPGDERKKADKKKFA